VKAGIGVTNLNPARPALAPAPAVEGAVAGAHAPRMPLRVEPASWLSSPRLASPRPDFPRACCTPRCLAQNASFSGDDVTTEVALLSALGLTTRDFRVLSLLGCGEKGAVFAAE
jgi:hypothetical protein